MKHPRVPSEEHPNVPVRQRASVLAQFTTTTIGGVSAASTAVFRRKRPSRATAYCGLLPRTLIPVARCVGKRATGVDGCAAAPEKVNDADIIVPSGAM